MRRRRFDPADASRSQKRTTTVIVRRNFDAPMEAVFVGGPAGRLLTLLGIPVVRIGFGQVLRLAERIARSTTHVTSSSNP